MIFTDAHSSSSVCTPTRYGVLTGRYNWRSRLQIGVLGGLSPRLIEPGRLTVAGAPQAARLPHGVHRQVAPGHGLGVEAGRRSSETTSKTAPEAGTSTSPGRSPTARTAVGFDYYFGISASLDMVPYTFIENDRVIALPTVDKQFPNDVRPHAGQTRKGPAAETSTPSTCCRR